MPFLPPNQQRQSTEGKDDVHYSKSLIIQISTVTIYASEIINWNILHSSELTLIQLEDYKKNKPPGMQVSIFGACPKPG